MVKDARLFAAELGLVFSATFLKRFAFYFALILAPLTLAVGWALLPEAFPVMQISWTAVLILVLWQPLIEELLFRGILQGQLIQQAWFSKSVLGLSRANIAVSMLFMAAHFFYHPPLWALAVFLPSLVFGWFRDQYQQIYPGFLLHAFYNGCFLLLSILWI